MGDEGNSAVGIVPDVALPSTTNTVDSNQNAQHQKMGEGMYQAFNASVPAQSNDSQKFDMIASLVGGGVAAAASVECPAAGAAISAVTAGLEDWYNSTHPPPPPPTPPPPQQLDFMPTATDNTNLNVDNGIQMAEEDE